MDVHQALSLSSWVWRRGGCKKTGREEEEGDTPSETEDHVLCRGKDGGMEEGESASTQSIKTKSHHPLSAFSPHCPYPDEFCFRIR